LEFSIPSDANLGLSKFIKPCDGYVSKEHSLTIPVYSPTMSDYRTHHGVDVTGEAGDVVYVVCGGIVRDIYDDDLYGKTVKIVLEEFIRPEVKFGSLEELKQQIEKDINYIK
jgi:murein DD-endopeptidase MepM/ murein hydrolase activator NlpD